ncbi:MAG TPA: TetR family transcriptional regulator [Minicystis sp.]|nr:TetR family transcriptional regulator [Minicystis sp.]
MKTTSAIAKGDTPRDRRTARRAPSRGRYDRTLSPEQRKKEQRRRLLDAAADVFALHGYAGASVEMIIDEAGMSRRTFYEHFDDLREILLELHDRSASLAFRFVEAAARSVDENDPVSRIRAGVSALLEIIAAYPDLSRIVFREVRAAGPEHELRRDVVLGRYVALLFELFSAAYARGFVSRAPDEVTLYTLVAGMESLAMRYVARDEIGRASEAVPALTDLVMRAFR